MAKDEKKTKSTSYKEFLEIVNTFRLIDYKKKTIFTLTCEKLGMSFNDFLQEYNDEINFINISHCLKDEKTQEVLRNELIIIDKEGSTNKQNNGDYKFSKGGLEKRKADIKKLNQQIIKLPTRILQPSDFINDPQYQTLSVTSQINLSGIVTGLTEDEIWASTVEKPTSDNIPATNGVEKATSE